MPHLTSASPQTLLEGLYAQLHPTPIWPTLPSALNIFAHLQLIAGRVRTESQRALDENALLVDELQDTEVPDEEWVGRGALKARQGKRLESWAERGVELTREEEMMDLSFELRVYHMALLLSNANAVPIEQSKKLLNTYFPAISSAPDKIASSKYCYIRAMTLEQGEQLALYREKVLRMYEKIDQAKQNGAARPTLKSLIPSAKPNHSQRLVQRILEVSANVVQDALRFEAMFPSEEDDGESSISIRTTDYSIADSHALYLDVPISSSPLHSAQQRQEHRGSQRQPTDHPLATAARGPQYLVSHSASPPPSDPPASASHHQHPTSSSPPPDPSQPHRVSSPHTEPPPIRAWNKPRASITPSKSKSLNARRSLGTPSRPRQSLPGIARVATPTSLSVSRPGNVKSPAGPDYTSPLASPSSDRILKPFPNSALVRPGHSSVHKRSRLSETHGLDEEEVARPEERIRTETAES